MSLEDFLGEESLDPNERERRKVADHNRAVRVHWAAISAIKEAIETDDMPWLAELWLNTPADVRDALWLAPSKGGIFTTKELEVLKSNAAFAARSDAQQEGEQ